MDKAVIYYSKKIKKLSKDNLKNIILYGSRARGDFNAGSDYDFLIVLKKKDNETLTKIKDCQIDFINRYDIIASNIILEDQEWEIEKKYPLGLNILKEGQIL